jgi:hypothetical protein
MTTNESKSPAASAAGAKRCSLAALPTMIGRSGSTQGDRTDKAPARNARPRVPRLMTCALERTFQERFDVAWIRLADRAGDFLGALAHDQGALLLGF